jgi:NADH:ubiquinone oxidoreductase subunit 3 (subunit A)
LNCDELFQILFLAFAFAFVYFPLSLLFLLLWALMRTLIPQLGFDENGGSGGIVFI